MKMCIYVIKRNVNILNWYIKIFFFFFNKTVRKNCFLHHFGVISVTLYGFAGIVCILNMNFVVASSSSSSFSVLYLFQVSYDDVIKGFWILNFLIALCKNNKTKVNQTNKSKRKHQRQFVFLFNFFFIILLIIFYLLFKCWWF